MRQEAIQGTLSLYTLNSILQEAVEELQSNSSDYCQKELSHYTKCIDIISKIKLDPSYSEDQCTLVVKNALTDFEKVISNPNIENECSTEDWIAIQKIKLFYEKVLSIIEVSLKDKETKVLVEFVTDEKSECKNESERAISPDSIKESKAP